MRMQNPYQLLMSCLINSKPAKPNLADRPTNVIMITNIYTQSKQGDLKGIFYANLSIRFHLSRQADCCHPQPESV
ncbi:MAG: hypothetical protein QNI95_15715, partial [Desulfobacterales bacterium]|nr:hypothetical protein [Desulfobacterales bacterium]